LQVSHRRKLIFLLKVSTSLTGGPVDFVLNYKRKSGATPGGKIVEEKTKREQ
jgi:hypothetical protein